MAKRKSVRLTPNSLTAAAGVGGAIGAIGTLGTLTPNSLTAAAGVGGAIGAIGTLGTLTPNSLTAAAGVGGAIGAIGTLGTLTPNSLTAAGVGGAIDALSDIHVPALPDDIISLPTGGARKKHKARVPPKSEPPPSPYADVERLEFQQAVLKEELAVLTEEPARVAHPDDDWDEWCCRSGK